ncbi:MAG: glycosyltransferase family 2 protein [Planctomycetota bacterium]
MTQPPPLSVVVPTHGRCDLFESTLQSLEAQSLNDFELIVTDDSAKESDQQAIRKLVDGYLSRTGRAGRYVFTKARLGQAGNTNQGLEATTGDIIRILHSDDLVREGCFEWELEQFSRWPQIDLLFQDCLPFYDETEIVWNDNPVLRVIEPADYFRQFLSTCTALPSGLLFKREGYEAVGGMRDDWSFLCDWELFAKLLIHALERRRFAGYAMAGNFAWRLHEESTTTTKWRDHFVEHEQLMEQWRETLHFEDCDLFVDEEDHEAFFVRGREYREGRLVEDVSRISTSEFKSSLSWFRQHLRSSLQRKILSRAGRRILQREILSALGADSTNNRGELGTPPSPAGVASPDWVPDLMITHMHYDPDSIPGCDCVVMPFDNTNNLHGLREKVASAKRIRIHHPNLNRFYNLTISECLKYVSVDAEIEFLFHDNQQLTWFGLKAVLNEVAPGRFRSIDQNQTPREGNEKGCSNWRLRFRCVAEGSPWELEPMTGVSIGVLTLGDRVEELGRLIETAREYCDVPYEIILISPDSITAYENEPDVKQIRFSERDDLGWITRKKNLICEAASFSDIVICHDRFEFTPSFFNTFHTWGCSYGIAAVRLKLPDGRRALDWGVVQGDNHAWCKGGLIHYRDYSRFSYVPGGVTMLRKSFWRQFPWCEELYWNEHEDVELCRRIQRAGHRVYFYPGLMIAARDRWVDENPLLPFSDQYDL